jgi:replicative DNA helicase
MMTLYESLDFSAREIRLANLLPGKESESIYCRLEHVSLDKKLDFEALSHSWSPSVELRPMLLNDHSHLTTDNLHRVLRRLRLKSQIRSPWVGLLCINQSDDAERAQQVQLMNSIYNDCTRTLL